MTVDAASCVRNGVDTKTFRPPGQSEIAEYRSAWDIPNGACVVAFVGQLTNAKGWQILREVAARLPSNIFLVARSLPDYAKRLRELRALNPDQIRVQVEENENRGSLPTRYADALLITSLSEVAPLVSSEALVSGVPVIATDCTPFFQELSNDGFAVKDISLVPLPADICEETMGNLKLSAKQSKATSSQIIDRLHEILPVNDSERKSRQMKAISIGIDQDQMLDEYTRLYSAID